MAVRHPGGVPPPGSPGSNTPEQAQTELKARNAAGKQARSAPKADYQRPHRVHTGAERKLAAERKRGEELVDEARRHMVHFREERDPLQAADIEDKQEHLIQAVSLDDERRRGNKRQQQHDQDQDAPDQETQEEAAAKSLGFTEGSGKYFQDLPADRLGDLSLNNPLDMKRILGPSVRFAQHAMLLAEEKMKEGIDRGAALAFLAGLYVGVGDRAYANKALREFGPATGIIDLYPLEVMQHLMQHVPSFLTKISTAKFLASRPVEGYKGKAGVPIVLKFDPLLRIRGFAIRGGEKPGYLLEPVDPPGTYQLTFATPGTFTVILSALTKTGQLYIEEFPVQVEPGDETALEETSALKRTRASVASADPDEAPLPEPTAGAAAEDPKPPKPKQDLRINIPRKI